MTFHGEWNYTIFPLIIKLCRLFLDSDLDHDRAKTDRRVMFNPVRQTKGELYVLQQWQLRSLRSPAQTQGRGEQDCLFCRLGSGCTGGRGLLGPRRSNLPGNRITILEQQTVARWCAGRHQGAAKRLRDPRRARDEQHFECLWDLYRSIPSLEIEGASVLDEFYWLDKDDPNSSLQRATVNRGEDAHTDGLFTLSEQAQKEIVKFFLATREEMENKRINEVFGEEF